MIQDFWFQRSPRERWILGIAALLVGYVAIAMPARWIVDRLDQMDRKVEKLRGDLVEAGSLAAEYERLSGRLKRMEARSRRGEARTPLLSFLENVSTRMGTRDRVVSMKPQEQTTAEGIQESSVEVRVENVGLAELVGMLALVEDSPDMLQIQRLKVKTRYNDPSKLDASFTVSALERPSS